MNRAGASILSNIAALALLDAAPKPWPVYDADLLMRDARLGETSAPVPESRAAGDPRGRITLEHPIHPDVP